MKRKPQEPVPPFPYCEEEVSFTNPTDGTILHGTLTLPAQTGRYPSAVLVTGSGAHNRNEEILGHKPFLVIADHLTRSGIAVLRYDDRHIKLPARKAASFTSAHFAEDARAAMAFLRADERIDHRKVGLAGHSEGGYIAALVASRDEQTAFVISLAGVGIPGREILRQQGSMFAKNDRHLEFTKAVHQVIFEIEDFTERKKRIWKTFTDIYTGLCLKDRIITWLSLTSLASEWLHSFIRLQPAEAWQRVRCPVLALNGEYDLQVYPAENLEAIEHALQRAGNENYMLRIIPRANHLFQIVNNGNPKSLTELIGEYGASEQTIAPEVLTLMSEWITSNSRDGNPPLRFRVSV